MDRIIDEALDLIFPEGLYCICCGDMLHKSRVHGLCDECISKIKWRSEAPLCSGRDLSEGFSFCRIISLADYDIYTKRIVHALKLKGGSYAARSMGRLMGELYTESSGTATGGCGALFVPVPMHSSKKRLRGFNQSELLAGYAAKAAGAELLSDALIKIRATKSMRLSRENERKTMLKGSVQINAAHASALRGRDIVLVDDVVTTGATAESCAAALMEAGAASVSVLSFAAVRYKAQSSE